LLVDELLSIADESFKKKFIQKLLEFKKMNKTILIASHDLKFLSEHTSKIFMFQEQKIIPVDLSSRRSVSDCGDLITFGDGHGAAP